MRNAGSGAAVDRRADAAPRGARCTGGGDRASLQTQQSRLLAVASSARFVSRCSRSRAAPCVDGFATGELVARKTPCAHTYGVRPSLSGTIEIARRDVASNSMMSSDPRLAAPCTACRPISLTAFTSNPLIETELHGLDPPRRRFAERLADDPVHAGRRHQRVRAVERRDLRIRALRRAAASSPHVGRLRGADERRLPGEVHPLERAERQQVAARRRKLLHARVHVDAAVEERRDDARARPRDRRRSRRWARRCATARLRTSTAAQSGVRPHQSARFGSAPCSSSSFATANCPLVSAITQRRDAVRIGRVDVGARLDEQRRRVEQAVPRREEQRRHAAGRRLLLALRRHAAADDADAVRAAAGAGRTDDGLLADARVRVDRRRRAPAGAA